MKIRHLVVIEVMKFDFIEKVNALFELGWEPLSDAVNIQIEGSQTMYSIILRKEE